METPALKQLLDSLFSQYTRRRFSDERGFCSCFTCSARGHWTDLQNGHFIPRSNMCTRYHEKNNHPQCVTCNEIKSGNLKAYARKLKQVYGEDTPEILAYLGKRTCRVDRMDMINMINELDYKIGVLIDGKGS